MSRLTRDALVYARDLLGDLAAQHHNGEINLGDANNLADVKQCQELCEQALREHEIGDNGGA